MTRDYLESDVSIRSGYASKCVNSSALGTSRSQYDFLNISLFLI